MTIPPDYFELRDAAESVVAAHDSRTAALRAGDLVLWQTASRDLDTSIAVLCMALAAGDECNGIEIVAGDKRWPHGDCGCKERWSGRYCPRTKCPRREAHNIGHIALALDGGMKETT